MKKVDLERWEATVMELVVRRRQLGEYNADAAAFLIMGEAVMRLYQHVIQNTPDDKPAKKKNEAD